MDNNTSNIENESNIENTSNIENESNHNRDMAMVSEDFSGKLILKYVLKHKWYVIIVTLLAAIGSVVFSLYMPNWYAATVNAVPPKAAGNALESMLGGFSSSLKELGLSKLAGSKGAGEQYSFLVILQSRVLADSMISKYKLKESYFPDEEKIKMSDVRKEFLSNLAVDNLDEGNYTVTILDKDSTRVAAMVMDYISMANSLAQRIYQSETQINKQYLETRLQGIDSLLKANAKGLAEYSRQTGIISPQDQGKAFVEAISSLKYEVYTQEIMYETMKNKFGENDANTLNQLKTLNSIKSKMRDAENKPGFAGNFSKQDAADKGLTFLAKSAEFEALTKLKLFIQPMLEEARINESRNLTTLTVVDPAITPDKKEKPKRSLIVASVTLGAMLLTILVLISIFAIKRLNYELRNEN